MNIPKPHFELTSVYDDGSKDEPQIMPMTQLPWDMKASRRGFLGTGVSLTALLAVSNPLKAFSTQSENELKAHSDSVNSVAFSPDGKLLASSSSDNTVKLWQLPEGRLLKTLHGHSKEVNSVAFSPDGKLLASGSSDNTLKLWQLPEGKLLKTLNEYSVVISSVAFSPDGKLLASGFWDNTVKLWQLPEGILLKTLKGHSNMVNSVVFSPDGKLLASGSYDNTVKLWQLPEGMLLKTLKGHSKSVKTVAFNSDGKLLASGSYDNTVKLQQLPEGTLLKTLTVHSASVKSVAFSPDGKLLASTCLLDYTVKLCQLPEGVLLKKLTGHSKDINSVAFSPDGKLLASGSWDNTVRLWNLTNYKFLTFLFDPSVNKDNAITYSVQNIETGITITYTLPCGSPIPMGAICTCNCVSGTYKEQTTRTDYYCSCNKVCTCVPVCQAHNLLHPDTNIRLIAKEIILIMGKKEWDYLEWAYTKANSKKLKNRIKAVMNLVESETKPNPDSWPDIIDLEKLLYSENPVISLMSAQIFGQRQVLEQPMPTHLVNKINDILLNAEKLHWKTRNDIEA